MGDLHIQIDEAVEAQAAGVLRELGLTMDQGVALLLGYVARDRRLPFSPNAETRAALEASLRGEGRHVNSVAALMADLNADD